MRLKWIGTLILAVVGLIAIAYSLTHGKLWTAGLIAYSVVLLLVIVGREKRALEAEARRLN